MCGKQLINVWLAFRILGLEINFDNFIGAICSTIFISKCKLKISNMPTQNASYTYKIIKIHFKSQNSKS
jgi:hypothetical protein